MSDTPRTDAVGESKFSRQLERELNAANDRIKRMDDALRSIVNQDCHNQQRIKHLEDVLQRIASEVLKEVP